MPKSMYNDQRIITIAREARGWTQAELGEKIFTEGSCVSRYERGMVRAPWEILYNVMPELREMRKHGCAYYCDTPHICRIAPCKYARCGRPRKEG